MRSLHDLQQIIPWIEYYRAACETNNAVLPVEEFLSQMTHQPDDEELTDLAYAEYMERIERHGTGSLEDLCQRFPSIAIGLRRQIAFQEAVDAKEYENSAIEAETIDSSSKRHSKQPGGLKDATVGRFQIIELIGSGGQGEVYRALDTQLHRDVVLKFLIPKSSPTDQPNLSRLLLEGQALARLKHQGIAQVYEVGEHDGRPYIAMEMVGGRNLLADSSTRVRSPKEAALFVAKLADALETAHQHGVVHCDIKPQNILVNKEGEPVLVDFGLAECIPAMSDEMSTTSGLSGTALYMAPEQASMETREVTFATDIFGLGGVLYFLLTGQAPYQGITGSKIFGYIQSAQWNRERLDKSNAPESLKSLCRRAMAQDPRQRFSGMREFAKALRQVERSYKHRRFFAVGIIAVAAVVAFAWMIIASGDFQKRKIVRSDFELALELKVFRGEKNFKLADILPILGSDEIQLSAMIPASGTILLIEVDGAGNLSLIDQSEVKDEKPGVWSFPKESDKTVQISGPAGTEAFVLLSFPGSAPDLKMLEEKWNTSSAKWPTLPVGTLMHVASNGTKYLQKSREVSSPKASENPALQVQARLESFCKALAEQVSGFDAIVFTKGD